MENTYNKSDLKTIKSILQDALDDLAAWSEHNEDKFRYEVDEIQHQINNI